MTDLELAKNYCPVFWMDEREPFAMKALGVSVFYADARSDSFPKRMVTADWEETRCVIEYAIWFDYDIQHLYELEHVWIWVGRDGLVQKVQGSFHGKFLNVVNLENGKVPFDENRRVSVYLQPGKHAVLADPRLVRIVPDWMESCNELSGADGVVIPEFFAGKISCDEELSKRVCSYIKEHFFFVPSLRWNAFSPNETMFVTWEELKARIPGWVNAELEKIRNS